MHVIIDQTIGFHNPLALAPTHTHKHDLICILEFDNNACCHKIINVCSKWIDFRAINDNLIYKNQWLNHSWLIWSMSGNHCKLMELLFFENQQSHFLMISIEFQITLNLKNLECFTSFTYECIHKKWNCKRKYMHQNISFVIWKSNMQWNSTVKKTE